MAIVAERYVQALLNSSENREQANKFEENLQDISNLFSSNNQFKNTLLNPCISNEEKISLIKEIFPEQCKNYVFLNFLNELLNKKRIGIIKEISDEYSKINSEINKKIAIKIVVASALSENQINDIVNKYKTIYKANTIDYTVELDESVIGGIKVIVNNTVYDSTIKTQLNQMF